MPLKMTFLENIVILRLTMVFSRMSISTVILSNYLYNDNLQLSSILPQLLPISKIHCRHYFLQTSSINYQITKHISLELIRNIEHHRVELFYKPCLNHVCVPVKMIYVASSVNFERINDSDLI